MVICIQVCGYLGKRSSCFKAITASLSSPGTGINSQPQRPRLPGNTASLQQHDLSQHAPASMASANFSSHSYCHLQQTEK